MASPSYQYKRLSRIFPSIRLIHLRPCGPRGEIRLALETATLAPLSAFGRDQVKCYTAISYTWGPPDVQRKVWIDDKFLLLRENIWNFLQHCSTTSFPVPELMWIDSICIN